MRIGIITHNFPESANDRQNAGIFVADIAHELSKDNDVFVYRPGKRKVFENFDKVKVVDFPPGGTKKLGDLKFWNPLDIAGFLSFLWAGIRNLSKFTSMGQTEVNLAMWAFPSGVFAYFAKKISGTPYAVWCLGSDIYVYGRKPILKTVIRYVLQNASYVFADGIDLAEKTETLSGRDCIFIPSASLVKVKTKAIKKTGKITKLAFVGRLEEVKGPDILIESLRSVKDDKSNFSVDIVGGGSQLKPLQEKVYQYGLSEIVNFHGNINEIKKISEILVKSDWLIIPSRSDSIPLVFSEAMKCGTPIVASDLPDLKYLIKKYKVGYTFRACDFRQLGEIIVKLPMLNKEHKRFVINTKVAADDFSVEVSAKKLRDYLQKLV